MSSLQSLSVNEDTFVSMQLSLSPCRTTFRIAVRLCASSKLNIKSCRKLKFGLQDLHDNHNQPRHLDEKIKDQGH